MEVITGNTILCSECLKEKKYIIPLYIRNKESNSIQYKCYKHNILNENNIYDCILTSKLKKKLKYCEIHEKIFCAWCSKCEKNLCQICLGDEFKKNHDYILYNAVLNENENFVKEYIVNDIKDLKFFLKEIKKQYDNIEEYKEDLDNLENIIKCNEFSYNLFYKENIINYQTILNIANNTDDLIKNYEKYELMYKKIYDIFLSFIKGKNIKDINQVKLPISKLKRKIFILNSELFDDQNNNQKSIYKNVFIVLNVENKLFSIYDMNGLAINIIRLGKFSLDESCKIIQYKSNVLMLFYKTFISFLIFSSDFKNYEITDEINLSKIIKDEYDNYLPIFYIPIFSLPIENKIIKINENIIALLYLNSLYIIKLNESLIFSYKKYYINKNIINESNKEKKLELIKTFKNKYLEIKNYFNILPIYFKNNEQKGINNVLTINFKGYLEKPDKLYDELLFKELGFDINKKKIVLKGCYDKKTKYLYILKNKLLNRTKYCNNFNEYYEENKYNESIWNLMTNIKIFVKIKKYDINFNLNNKFKFILNRNDIIKLFKYTETYSDLIYSYSKNYILFLLNDTIYQINYNNSQVITIYELNIFLPNDLKLSQNYIVSKIHIIIKI